MPDPHAQLAHALLASLVPGNSPADVEAMERWQAQVLGNAVQRDPDDPLIARVHALRCLRRRECDGRAALAHIQRIEPDNAATWMMGIRPALARGDRKAAEALLIRAA
jgi:hypothetical protein